VLLWYVPTHNYALLKAYISVAMVCTNA